MPSIMIAIREAEIIKRIQDITQHSE
jgi:hypothetical protein